MINWKILCAAALLLVVGVQAAFAADLTVSGNILPAAPDIDFSATPTSGFRPLTVAFTATNTGGAADTWDWDFGDGTTHGTVQSPSHQYTVAGNYTVKLTATNTGGSDVEEKIGFITVNPNIDLTIAGLVNCAPANAIFAKEPNTITISNIKNLGTDAATNIVVKVYASDVDGGNTPIATATIASLGAGATVSLSGTTALTDQTLRQEEGTARYTAKVDPDGLIPETNESNNYKLSAIKQVKFNGYKGVQYWNSTKTPPRTYLSYDIHGSVIHSFGDSSYVSGKGDRWQTLTWNWTAADLPVPAGATIKEARLYIPYCWDYENEVAGGLTTTTFNGITVTPAHLETDESNSFAYDDFQYGLVTYDVTSLYVKNDDNVATFTRTYWNTSPSNVYQAGSLSPAGFTLLVVYEDASETRKQIFINEGWDLLGASLNSYGTTEEEATSYQSYTGMAIDMASATKANLTTFVPWGAGDPGEGNLYVNGVQIGHDVWSYGAETTGSGNGPQVAVDTRDVLSYLYSNGTGNGIAIQSTAGATPCMVAERSLLVVEYPATPVTASFTPDAQVTIDAGASIGFDASASAGDIVSYSWDFNGDGIVDQTTTGPAISHTYDTSGTYDVSLTVNGAGSGNTATVTKADLVVVREPAPVVDFAYTPASGTAPLTIAFDATNTGGQVTSWKWEYSTDGTTWNQFATTEDPSYTFNDGTYSIRVTATGPDYADTETKNNIISVGAATISVDVSPATIDFGTMSPGIDETGVAQVAVGTSGGTAWSVTASANNGGYMSSGTSSLASPFELSNDGTGFHAMTTDFPNFLTGTPDEDRTGTASVNQAIGAGDQPGSYSIMLTFTGGFI